MISAHYEQPYWQKDILVVGIDEAGRGALAGPVVAAAVVFRPDCMPARINDSKLLKPLHREHLSKEIFSVALSVGVGIVQAQEIDEVNILQATFTAMHLAVEECMNALGQEFRVHLLVDGNRFRPHQYPHTTIVDGDARCVSIAAASIIAKTTRDAIMTQAHDTFPEYGFASHKGYATREHRAAILSNGPTSIHRKSFLGNFFAETLRIPNL